MAARGKVARLESEIERCRLDGEWKKVLELVTQLPSKSSTLEYYTHFIIGESNLESYALENPSPELVSTADKKELQSAEKHLNMVLKENGKLHLEATLLMAKAQYLQGAYQSALNLFDGANLDVVTVKEIRRLHIVAEAYAVKGLCLEKSSPITTSKYKAAEMEEKILKCFEMAGDRALLYLQKKEEAQSSNSFMASGAWGTLASSEESSSVGNILEKAIQQSPIYYIKRGELQKGILRFRDLLRSVESRFSQGLRLTLARQLAEVLLRGVCENTYVPPDAKPPEKQNNKLQPRKYTGDRLFVPQNENEEALLLLLIAEAVATRDVVLNREAEHQEVRLHTFHNTTAVYDLLAVALVKRAQFQKLAESLERAMKFSFEEFHIWHQFANSLICARKFSRAVLVLKECCRLRPQNVIVPLQAAKLCYEYLHQYDEGIKFSKAALQGGEEHPLISRAYVALGMGYSLKAMEMKLKGDRQDLHCRALKAFQKAHILDPNDYLSLFHLALQLSILRQIEDAIKYTRLSLKYYSDHVHSLHLLVLLLTAQKQYHEALDLMNAALEEYPDNVSLLLTKSKIEEVVFGPEKALNTCRKMMKLWKELQEISVEESFPAGASQKKSSLTVTDRSQFDRRSQAHLQLNEFTDRDTGSLRAESIAASRMEQTLSDLASSMNSGSFHHRGGGHHQTWRLQTQIWMNLSELYLSLDRVQEAESCVMETSAIFPLSHQVAFMKGRVYEHKQKYAEAKVCYEDSISINPGHTRSLQHLGLVVHYLDNDKLAEKILRDAVNTDPTSHKSWYSLGMVLHALGQSDAASECQSTALDLESTSPIVPFTVIPHLMQ